jgi:capsular polysaccharide transport system permease protein
MIPVGPLLKQILKPRNHAADLNGSASAEIDEKPEASAFGLANLPPTAKRRSLLSRQNLTRVILVVPILIAGYYFFFVGRPRYPTTADVVIRSADDQSSAITDGALGLLLGATTRSSQEDAKFLTVFLASPQMEELMLRELDFRKNYAFNGTDPFGGLAKDASQEETFKFYKNQISVAPNEQTGTLLIRSQAFDPATSFQFNKLLLKNAERFVNEISQSISSKQLAFALEELASSRKRLEQSRLKLLQYQDKNQQLNPADEAAGASQLISGLEAKLVEFRIQLATLEEQFKDPNAPEVELIRDQVNAIERQLIKERKRNVSTGGRNLSRRTSEFLELESEVKYHEDLYKLAISAVEKARIESDRQQKFLITLANPRKAEDQDNSWRYKGFFSVVVIWLGGYILTKFALGMAAQRYE